MTDSATSAQALPGRRERNKQRVKNHLYESAIKLITVKGYEHTSVDEIAEEADVARGTFFNHFQRKEDLITTWGSGAGSGSRSASAARRVSRRCASSPRWSDVWTSCARSTRRSGTSLGPC